MSYLKDEAIRVLNELHSGNRIEYTDAAALKRDIEKETFYRQRI